MHRQEPTRSTEASQSSLRVLFAASALVCLWMNMPASEAQERAEDELAEPPSDLEDKPAQAEVTGILIGTYQTTDQAVVSGLDVDGEGNAQLFVEGTLALGPGSWLVELRAGTTPRSNGIIAAFGEANAAVGETLDQDGDGRLAVTQLFYELSLGAHALSAGLLDPTLALDNNDVANFEYAQFLGDSFVNNPTIGFPSFVLAASYGVNISDALFFRAFVSSSSGLEDPDDPTYANVVSPGDDGKGLFAVGEARWELGVLEGNLGVWSNTADHLHLGRASEHHHNHGAYTNIGGALGAGQWNVRLGVARASVSPAANFIAAELSYPLGRVTLASGISRTGASSDLPGGGADILHGEIYARVNLVDEVYISPDIQYIANSGFDPDRDGLVAGVRVGAEF